MPPLEFERLRATFRGANDKRLHEPQLIVDAIDVGLFGQIEPYAVPESVGPRFSTNKALWGDLLSGSLSHGDEVILDRFQLLEWLPASPGRFFTSNAVGGRERAKRFWDMTDGEYLPLGKSEMVLGGVGSVRLAPRLIRGGEVCFFCATSNGISHQGIPVVVPIDEGRDILKDIRAKGAWAGSLTGTLWPLPIEQSPIAFDREIPKYFLFAERLERTGSVTSNPLVTVAITYNSTYGVGRPELVGDFQINPSKNWSFASFDPSKGPTALKMAVDWLKQYAVRHTSTYQDGKRKELPAETLAIVGDFDDVHKHFDNPIEFPLASILSGQYDKRVLEFYGRAMHLTIKKEIIMGDKFENIHNATIINRSYVQDAIKSVQASAGTEVSEALKSVATAVEESKNAAAGALFNSFTGELNKPMPDKSALKQCWDGLTKMLPDVATIAAAGAKIATLFS